MTATLLDDRMTLVHTDSSFGHRVCSHLSFSYVTVSKDCSDTEVSKMHLLFLMKVQPLQPSSARQIMHRARPEWCIHKHYTYQKFLPLLGHQMHVVHTRAAIKFFFPLPTRKRPGCFGAKLHQLLFLITEAWQDSKCFFLRVGRDPAFTGEKTIKFRESFPPVSPSFVMVWSWRWINTRRSEL